MPYQITGLVVRSAEIAMPDTDRLAKVPLNLGYTLIPMSNKHILLTDGQDTEAKADFTFEAPKWLSEIAGRYTSAAYIEADIWGGEGMQASICFSKDSVEALISSRAINYALRFLGVENEKSEGGLFGLLDSHGKDPFDLLGLGKHRSVEGWLAEEAEQVSGGNGEQRS